MAAAALRTGNSLFVDGQFDLALVQYDKCVSLDGGNADHYIKRAAAHNALHQFADALQDASKAIKLGSLLGTGHYHKGIAGFWLEEFESAKDALTKAQELFGATAGKHVDAELKKWIRKCEAELADMSDEDEEDEDEPASSNAAAPPPVPEPCAAIKAAPVARAAPRYEHYQSAKHVVVSIFQKGLSEDQVKVRFETTKCIVDMATPDGSSHSLEWNLCGEIDPAASSFRCSKVKVTVKLAKKERGSQWASLIAAKGRIAAPVVTAKETSSAAAAPTVYSGSKKDWTKVDKWCEEELEKEKPEGEQALQKLFRDIYSKADEDTRRAMNKSYQTSGGTVLSTNWGEVGTTDYEKTRTAPEGMEWKKWDKSAKSSTDS